MQGDKEPASHHGITIIPSSAQYADQMETITGIIYGVHPREEDECFNADHYRHHLSIFPEGQFIAVDTQTDTVVGLTASMRCNFNLERPTHASWWEVVGFG
jgi:hypothetical protein